MSRCLLVTAITGSIVLLFMDWHIVSFYLLFELSILILIPVLTTSSRSYRKSYAMFIMLIVIIIGTFFYSVLICRMVASEPSTLIAASNVVDDECARVQPRSDGFRCNLKLSSTTLENGLSRTNC